MSTARTLREVALQTKRLREERVIVRDSDGNACRVSYADGVVDEAVRRATPQRSNAAIIKVMCETFEEYERRVLPADYATT